MWPPIFDWVYLIPISILLLTIFGIPRVYKWRGYDKEGNKIIKETGKYMKTTITTSTHKVKFETMDEVKELHKILDFTIKAWELSGVKEMGPIKPIPLVPLEPEWPDKPEMISETGVNMKKDPILDESV